MKVLEGIGETGRVATDLHEDQHVPWQILQGGIRGCPVKMLSNVVWAYQMFSIMSFSLLRKNASSRQYVQWITSCMWVDLVNTMYINQNVLTNHFLGIFSTSQAARCLQDQTRAQGSFEQLIPGKVIAASQKLERGTLGGWSPTSCRSAFWCSTMHVCQQRASGSTGWLAT